MNKYIILALAASILLPGATLDAKKNKGQSSRTSTTATIVSSDGSSIVLNGEDLERYTDENGVAVLSSEDISKIREEASKAREAGKKARAEAEKARKEASKAREAAQKAKASGKARTYSSTTRHNSSQSDKKGYSSVFSGSNRLSSDKKINVRDGLERVTNYTVLDIEYRQGPKNEIRLEGPSSLLTGVSTNYSNGQITFRHNSDNANASDLDECKIVIETGDVPYFMLYATGDLDLGTLTSKNLTVYNYGTGDVKCRNANVDELTLGNYGTGDFSIDHVSSTFSTLTNAGIGDIWVKSVNGNQFTVSNPGTGDVRLGLVTLSALRVSDTGTGDVYIDGGDVGIGTFTRTGLGDIFTGKVKIGKTTLYDYGN